MINTLTTSYAYSSCPPLFFLFIPPEEYDAASAESNVRRLADIFSCLAAFGKNPKHVPPPTPAPAPPPPSSQDLSVNPAPSTHLPAPETLTENALDKKEGGRRKGVKGWGQKAGGVEEKESKLVPFANEEEANVAMKIAAESTERRDMGGMIPIDSEIGDFYGFFSAAHLTAPITGEEKKWQKWQKGRD